MADDGLRPIIVKRIKKSGGGGHGGAWKIAYADFVTAMMAFFLLMWLLGSTTKGDLQGIADYFQTPLKVAMAGGSGSGDSSSVLKGGGKDLTRSNGQVQKSDDPTKSRKTFNLKAAQAELAKAEAAQLQNLKQRIEAAIETNPTLKQYKNQLLLDITSDGLRIQIVDEQNRPMFALAKADLQPYTKEILFDIGQLLNDIPNKISLSGHTDASAYSSGEKGYSNWELSADRANASRRALVAGGMDESKVLRVVGLSSAVPFNKNDPMDPVNRRISIIVMNKKAEEAITKEGVTVDVANEEQAKEELAAPAPAPVAAPPAAAAPK
ncbi:MAG: flagellar motor protein MotB [Burkholderiaceae bacterium]|nr:flagellar motor protein MotB [Burkholderiaceae bacterium]